MDEKRRDRQDDLRNKGAGIRVPLPGESSSSGSTPGLDSPTLIDIPDRKISDLPGRRISSDAPTMLGVPATPRPASGPFNVYAGVPILEVGTVLGQRYEILHILGIGGMGAVYQARDLELSRIVAVKVIRPDLAGNQSIIDRFKQELILATQVTHKNVVRIYDLGESDGMKFITMEFVEGQDLRSLIQERTKLSPVEAVEIMQQVCRALEAAHAVGVIHRDLKPQNIMRDVNGRVVVMDFGLARTLGSDGMTQSGALVGTMEYMSPEQALAKELDQRSDIFSLGVIFYELLSGAIPFRADSALASLIKRTQERVVPVSELDDTIPAPLSAIVTRCLERDLAERYQTSAQLLADLEAWQGRRAISEAPPARKENAKQGLGKNAWLLIGSGVVAILLALAIGGYFVLRPAAKPETSTRGAAVNPAFTLAVLPLHNASGDPKLDWLGPYLADTLSTDIGQSEQLHTISSGRLHQVMSDLQVQPGTIVDADMLRHVVDLTGTDIAVSGQYVRLGDQIQIDASVRDFKHTRTVAVKATAASDRALPAAIDALADEVRKSLAFSSSEVNKLQNQAFKPTSQSLDALRDFNQGLELMRVGRNIEASSSFQSAVEADPQFALAYSALGQTRASLGHEADAQQSSRRAVELASSENLPQLESSLIAAAHATILDDSKKAIGIYESLAQSMPSNVDVQYALGTLYSDTGDYPKARAQFTKILEADPKNVIALWQLGIVEGQSGQPQAALDPLSKAEYLTIQTDNKEQHAMILLSMGITYRLLQKRDEALRYFDEAIAISEKIGQKRAVAAGLDETAQMQLDMGKSDEALANYKKALALFQQIGSNKEAGDALIDMAGVYQARDQNDQALQLFRQALQVERDAGDQNNEALCLNDIGDLHLAKGDTESAFTYFQQALQLGEKIEVPQRIAEPLQGLGSAYTMTGQYDQALSSLKRALDIWRSNGNALGVASTQSQMGLIFGYQARFGAAVDSIQSAVKGFEALGDKSTDAAMALVNLAEALGRAGRGDEAGPLLDQAESLAKELKNETLLASVQGTQGKTSLYIVETLPEPAHNSPLLSNPHPEGAVRTG
ncbi:Serine/threonine-protein kinase PknB [Acidisarcina polymorpha]|uniref:non-specific serine/threonine protein kinase n=1 Tax=Acidisarcina polymorpha TaxID=2211140 RepID=A0A2Z5G135_9BACT|nr:tetratricopeptide repeat protein [Acidisarcina polymorpha]AXC12873.1 Serine/threonine-protein kinase PknB [Acidisarcina polymorpha]